MPVAEPADASALIPVPDVESRPPVRHAGCRDTCVFDPAAEWHHARLRTLETDQDALLEFLELAITCHELEYAESSVIPPDQWMAFAENHSWADPDRVERIFSIATDVAMAARRADVERPGPSGTPPMCPAAPTL